MQQIHKINNSTLPKDIGTLYFGEGSHAQACLTKPNIYYMI